MIEPYLRAAITQARERAKVLKTKMPSPLRAAEFSGLQARSEKMLDDIITNLNVLLDNPLLTKPELIKERIRRFRRTLDDLAMLENTAIAALNRVNDDDVVLNKLVFAIHQEINYPLSPPCVTSLSQQYYSIYSKLGLLSVPLAESNFLLHLPDLYHELAHPMIAATDNPKVEPFQTQFNKFLGVVEAHFRAERAANARSTGPKDYMAYVLSSLEQSWISWAEELFCDLFATYTLGPAFAWAHFHLVAARGADPFSVRAEAITTHPPDQARMEAILTGLELLEFSTEAAAIKARWNELLKALGAKPDPMYRKACPQPVLEQVAILSLEGTKTIGCKLASTPDETKNDQVRSLLDTAWKTFWQAPDTYAAWEKEAIQALRAQAGVSA